jgi:hypothetical protein
MSGGIGNQFQSVYKAPAQANGGKTSGMSASAAKVNGSAKFAVPAGKGKGAFGQAKYAKNMSAKAATYSGAQSAGLATQAMSGETAGSGDVGAPGLKATTPALAATIPRLPRCRILLT